MKHWLTRFVQRPRRFAQRPILGSEKIPRYCALPLPSLVWLIWVMICPDQRTRPLVWTRSRRCRPSGEKGGGAFVAPGICPSTVAGVMSPGRRMSAGPSLQLEIYSIQEVEARGCLVLGVDGEYERMHYR